jgi:hypothetical protein
LVLATLLTAPAHAQRIRSDGLRQCERHAAQQFRRHDPTFRRFIIDRSTVQTDRFADKVGTQFISIIYHGRALHETALGPRSVRFICLHGGIARGPVFVYALPE